MPYDPYQNNDQNNNNNSSPAQQGAPRTPSQQFAMVSITFAILGLVTFFLIFTPICFGSLASFAIPLGTAAIILGIAVLVFGIITIITQFGSFENYIMLIEQQVLNYENGSAGTLDMSQFMENFGGQ